MQHASTLSRRSLIAGTVALGCATAAATASLAHADETTAFNATYDVVVVGGGAAGHAAAYEAAQAGASVVLLEAAETVGGDSARCAGILAGWGTKLAQALGVECTADEIYDSFVSHPEQFGTLDPAVARLHADSCGETIDWLADLGVPFIEFVGPRFAYTDLPVIHLVDGGGFKMMEVLEAAVAEAGVETLLQTRAVRLVMDGDRAVGVEAIQNGTPVRFGANRGVVIACGGYSGSAEMLATMSPGNANLFPGSAPTDQGDGIVMGMEAGAMTTRLAHQPLTSSLVGMMTGTALNLDYFSRLHGILLDAEAQRFCDESPDYRTGITGRNILRQQNLQGGKPVVYLLGSNPDSDAYLAENPLNWPTADTVEEIAELVGLDPQALAQTVEQYNAYCAEGLDRDFLRDPADMAELLPPFYAADVTVSTSVTVGGLKVDTEARVQKLVIGAEGPGAPEPMPALYAAGCSCEWNVANGWTVLSGMTMGRIAGRNAAAEEPVA